jgi:hypothetical protein
MTLANFCTQCGQEMEIESKFCSKCGTKRQTFKQLNTVLEETASGNQLKDFDLLLNNPNIEPLIKKVSSKKPLNKMVFILVSSVIAFLSAVLIIGVASEPESVKVKSSSSESVCENLNSEVYSYFDYLQGWTVGSDSEDLFTVSNETAQRIADIAQVVANGNIEWDSGPIVTNLLVNIANDILRIGEGVSSGKYPAGNYESFKSLYPELDLSFQPVMNSACNQ